jgi:muconolactone delta-isomerase
MPLLVQLSEEIGDYVNVVFFPIDDKDEFKNNFRGKLPQFRTFRNVQVG